jgi:hypothetical protein
MGDIKGIKDGTRGCDFNNRFQFETIGSVITQNAVGYTCLNGELDGKFYWNYLQREQQSSTVNGQGQGGYPFSTAQLSVTNGGDGSCNSTNRSWYAYRINKYGDIEIDTGYDTMSQGNGNAFWNPNDAFEYYFCDPVVDECTCEPTSSSGGGFVSTYKDPFGQPKESSSGTVDCGPGVGRIGGGACNNRNIGATKYECEEASNESTSCTNYSYNGSGSDAFISAMLYLCGGLYIRTLECRTDPSSIGCYRAMIFDKRKSYQTSTNTTLSEEKDWSFFFSIAKESSTKKLSILENNLPQNSNGDDCGSEPEDCWSLWNGTSVLDTGAGAGSITATSQKWKTRVRKVDLNDETLQKYTVIVESKYYLQIPVEDSDPIRILVDSGTDTFSGNQSRGSKHDFTNEDFQAQIGQPIYGCLNITRIDRL